MKLINHLSFIRIYQLCQTLWILIVKVSIKFSGITLEIGKLIGFKGQLIHSLNKNKGSVPPEISNKLNHASERGNIVLLGTCSLMVLT